MNVSENKLPHFADVSWKLANVTIPLRRPGKVIQRHEDVWSIAIIIRTSELVRAVSLQLIRS